MALDKTCTDRSYLFGRLLAVLEKVERSSNRDEGRETNAIRRQTKFCQQPMHAWANIEGALNHYYARLAPGLRDYFKDIVGEICDKLPGSDAPALNAPLNEVYLLGYYLQRAELNKSKKADADRNKEELEDESAAQ